MLMFGSLIKLEQTDRSDIKEDKHDLPWLIRTCMCTYRCVVLYCMSSRTWSCCCLASSICCLCFSICEAASFFCSSWAARSCSLRLLNWPIMPISWRSFSARLSGVPRAGRGERSEVSGKHFEENGTAWLRLRYESSFILLKGFCSRSGGRSQTRGSFCLKSFWVKSDGHEQCNSETLCENVRIKPMSTVRSANVTLKKLFGHGELLSTSTYSAAYFIMCMYKKLPRQLL